MSQTLKVGVVGMLLAAGAITAAAIASSSGEQRAALPLATGQVIQVGSSYFEISRTSLPYDAALLAARQLRHNGRPGRLAILDTSAKVSGGAPEPARWRRPKPSQS